MSRPEVRGDVVTWSAGQRLPVVGQHGDVPVEVRTALTSVLRLDGSSAAAKAAASYVEFFLTDVCDDLAEARAQVLADRAERDQLRAFKRAALTEQAQRRAAVEQAAARYASHSA